LNIEFLKLEKGMNLMMEGLFKVQDVLENYKKAVYEKDVEKFLSMYAPEMHIYDCWGNWEINGTSSWKKNVAEWFNGLSEDGVLLNVDFNDLVVEENSTLAFAHCAVTFAAHQEESGEKLRQMTNRFTFCLKKANESWVIVHEHSSLPINMETGKGIFNLK
jgi:ketosteroid isomerase-like protein